jgi:hypothetical protein
MGLFNASKNADKMAARRETRARSYRNAARKADQKGDSKRAAFYRQVAEESENEMRKLLGY